MAQSYKLLSKTKLTNDSFILRYALSSSNAILGSDSRIPTCIKINYAPPKDLLSQGDKKQLSKSYSPVSHPNRLGDFELIVKSYKYRPGGGVGKYICDMQIGESIEATLKKERIMHGKAQVLGRWKHVGLVGGGTGIAPLLQIARIILDSNDETKIYLLFINRTEEDILGRTIIDQMARDYFNKFFVHYSLTREEKDNFLHGPGDVAMAQTALPDPTEDDTLILVCGKDGFVEHWAGPVGRAPSKPDGSKGGKIQGPLLGILAEAGFTAEQVFKY